MSQLQRVDLIASLRNYVDKIATDKDIGGNGFEKLKNFIAIHSKSHQQA